jgi:type VI secretion system protein ImpJ
VKTVKNQTARVHWRMGQALLPEHFFAQEGSLREEGLLRARLGALPAWGVGALTWDAFQLVRGILSVEELKLFFPSGSLVDIPGNTAPTTFNLNTTGQTRTPLYLHLLGEFDVAVEEAADGSEDSALERIVQRVAFSSQPYPEEAARPAVIGRSALEAGSSVAAQSFKLAEFEKAADGTWSLAPDYLPPALRVTGSPFFEPTLKRARALTDLLHQVLVDEIRDNYLAGQTLASAKEALKALYRFKRFLANVGQELHPHPFALFEAVRELYLETCMLRGTEPKELWRPYVHDGLGPLFKDLFAGLESQVQLSRSSTPYVAFTRREGLQLCALPEAARKARSVFWLLQKPRVATKLELGGVKLASESRLATVHQLALRGIAYKRIENPPFHHPFSSEVEFYSLSEGEEWDHAVRDGKLAFFHRPDFEQVKAFVYWRNE